MKEIKNEWLFANRKKISLIQRYLIEKSYQGAPEGDLDLAAINNLLGGAVLEITKLQEQITENKLDLEEVMPILEVVERKSILDKINFFNRLFPIPGSGFHRRRPRYPLVDRADGHRRVSGGCGPAGADAFGGDHRRGSAGGAPGPISG